MCILRGSIGVSRIWIYESTPYSKHHITTAILPPITNLIVTEGNKSCNEILNSGHSKFGAMHQYSSTVRFSSATCCPPLKKSSPIWAALLRGEEVFVDYLSGL
jgi:hypothetical protein